MKYVKSIYEKRPKGSPKWHDADWPDAEGRFKELSPKDLAAWLIKTRKKDLKAISGALTQQVVFNRKEDPKYAEKMEKTRKEVYKQLGRKDLLEKVNINKVEDYADDVLDPTDVEFTRHFFDRLTRVEHDKDITDAELIGFFKRLAKKKKQFDSFMKQYDEFIVKDKRTDINIPFIKRVNQIIAKTIMRKKDFISSNPTYTFEAYMINEIGDAMVTNEAKSNDSFNDYPAAAKANAKKALEWKDKYGREEVDAGTPVGWARANQLAKGENLSAETVKRMAAFNRHRKNSKIATEYKDTPWKDRGYVAWLIWGGDEGVDWAIEKSKEIDNMKESTSLKYVQTLNEFNRGKDENNYSLGA